MNLNGTWTLYYCEEGSHPGITPETLAMSGIPSIACTVPGNVELDLAKAGILPADLFRGENIRLAEKYEIYEWWYVRSFAAPAPPKRDERAILAFGGVDCFAEYFLNNGKIGESEDMLISQEFDVTDSLRWSEANMLCVHLSSASIRGASCEIEPNCAAFSWHKTMSSVNVRKAPHSFGWDIMPRALSAGIWRGVELSNKSKYGFKYIYIQTVEVREDAATVRFVFDTSLEPKYIYSDLTYKIAGTCGNHHFEHAATLKTGCAQIMFDIPGLKLWWPKGYGEPNLYDITMEVLTNENKLLFRSKLRRGFRSLRLNRSETIGEGGSFDFVVNNVRIMAVGSNWVPMDVYHSRDQGRLRRALELADDIGCGILRCWGGNVYEPEEFFNFCDEHGIMVWQDFAMACHYYPQNERFAELIRREAEWVVRHERDHCCLVVWAGDNEVDSLSRDVDPACNRLTREVIPAVLRRLDPYRPYLPSSPYISPKAYKRGREYEPEAHLWGPRDYYKSDFYTQSKAYFVSETGYHGCPAKKSIEKFIDPEFVWPYFNNKQWNLHSTDQNNDPGRVMLMHNQVSQLFADVPTDMEDYILASQISQAEAVKFFIERVRCQMARMGGVIWWNLIDGWPQMSEAVVDYFYEKKLAYDYIRRSSRPFMIMMGELDGWSHPVIAANSSLKFMRGHVRVTDLDTGKIALENDYAVRENANTVVGYVEIRRAQKGMFLIEWQSDDGKSAFNTYLYGTPPYDLQRYKSWLGRLAAQSEQRKEERGNG